MPDLAPQTFFTGTIMIVAPHMDDEVLACGGLIAKLSQKERIHVVYATDGMRSPSPIFPGRDKITPDLGKVRVQESIEAMKLLGVPEQNLHFLCLPEAELRQNKPALQERMKVLIQEINPEHILVPFRYDRHPDHLVVNHVVAAEVEQGKLKARIVEYFVYYRWRLIPKGEIQQYIRPQFLYKLDISEAADTKRKALDCFTSQTTIFYPWQTRPILTATLLDEECQTPEYFVISNSTAGPDVFSSSVLWIRVVHRIEPKLQKWKYLAGAYLKRALNKNGS